MSQEIIILAITAANIAFFHTLFGPDHYLPFIVLSKARNWSLWKTAWITFLCGLGHVGSSILLGAIGVAFGIGVASLEFFEGFRGNLVAWLFIIFGIGYFVWGIFKAQNRNHSHHHHHHHHVDNQHKTDSTKKKLTPWILFTLFVLGPCEPLIPILMYPAAKSSTPGLILVTAVFAIITIATMLAVVLLSTFGVSFIRLGKLEPYTHAIAGATIFLSGAAIQFLGL